MIKKGFTLVELIIVVAILAILAAFAVPNYFNFLKTVTITEQTEKVAAELRYIRDYASARSIPCVLTITAPNGTTGSYRFNEVDSNGEDIVLPSEPTVEIPFPDNVIVTANPDDVTFTDTGRPDEEIRITLTNSQEDLSKDIIINQVTGRVSIQ
ncbi:MAG: GspH/FimT family pseudopilin [Candidatus Marinimicrobia bacterium]|nr:GspH/FimT family pseudopilin [Candidatus Neomarinimicrobiota bacterium]MDP6614453.1 GspH/FimT family pseudopilin [Candidatus Neomarinimicrobiota bacterium]MDP6821572.1 GspH/FimT family pseudopilin [Candidatus Neomarinimicrobiota bacterium]